MNGITITHEHLMTAVMMIPVLTGSYLIFRKRKWMWGNRRIITNVSLALITVASIVGTGTYQIKLAEARKTEQQRQIKLSKTERQERIKLSNAEKEKWDAEKQRARIKKSQQAKQAKLPGQWWKLYLSMKSCSYWEAKLSAIEAFPLYYPVDSIEPLPVTGFNLILDEISREDDASGATAKRIIRAKTALQQYIMPCEPTKPTIVKPWNVPETVASKTKN